ncbi:uncharacterized protein LOC114294425 [Camellia sinensis]|uniref:uncharacterized protein LOC114294425 n=1 Tax=Camellia sinensis TaxID=4442 RepID=UPI001035D1FD|nr:uncharacterized protein LOC114294425 [Camellia sinensis]
MKRACSQLGGVSGASGSRQTQSHQQTHSVQTSRVHQGAASAQSVQQAYAPRDEQVDQRPQGRVYAVIAPEQMPGPSVMRGIFIVCNSLASVLIDTGASHSFIFAAFESALGLEVAQLASPLRVESPVGGTVDLDWGCRDCEIEVARRRLSFAFVLLDMSSFDVILGMDWLSSYRAVIDCFRQRVSVCTSGGDCFYFLGDRVDRALSPVFDPRSKSELSSLLATLLNSESVGTRVELPRVVCEYPKVFPEDLISLPPHQEIEFTIDLVPGTTPISMAPYRFAPAE